MHPLDPKSIQNQGRVKALCDLTWAAAAGIAPLTDEEFAWLAHGFARHLDPRFCIAIERAGELVALGVRLPDESPEIKQLLCLDLIGRAAANGYRSIEFAPIAADDQPLISELTLLGARAAKRYRVYEKRFGPDW